MLTTVDLSQPTTNNGLNERGVCLPAASVARTLRLAHPHMSHDEDTPLLNGVSVQRRQGELTFAATNRYTLAAVTHSVEDPDDMETPITWRFLIPARQVNWLIEHLDPSDAYVQVGWHTPDQAEIAGHRLTIDPRSNFFAPWRRLLADFTPQPPGDLTFDPRLMARFAAVQEEMGDPPRWRFNTRRAVCVCGGVATSDFQVFHGALACIVDKGEFTDVDLPAAPPAPDGNGIPPRP